MTDERERQSPVVAREVDLLYPFYLDADMSMAFAAALTGGVALEAEQVDRMSDASSAMKNLRGNLNLWRVGGVGAAGETTEASEAASESRLIRRHTEASIFITLYDELDRTGRLRREPTFADMAVRDIVAMEMGPAVAPLRRVVEQVIRLLDLAMPVIGAEGKSGSSGSSSSHGRPKRGGPGGHHAPREPSQAGEYKALRGLFQALSDDLEHSGMIDVVVDRGDQPNAVLTLDERFVSAPTLELLHTSRFTVVGKVSQIWRTEEEFVNLYRRSVLSLVPALAQATAWGLFGLLAGMGSEIDVQEMQRAANQALGLPTPIPEPPDSSAADEHAQSSDARSAGSADSDGAPPTGVMMSPEAVNALLPLITGPAFQVLPLAICS